MWFTEFCSLRLSTVFFNLRCSGLWALWCRGLLVYGFCTSLIYGTCGLNTHCVPDPSMSFHKAATYSDPCHLMPLINKWHATYSYSAVVDHCLVVFTVQRASTLCGQWFGNKSLDLYLYVNVSLYSIGLVFHAWRATGPKKNVVVALPSIHATSTWNLCGDIFCDFAPKVKFQVSLWPPWIRPVGAYFLGGVEENAQKTTSRTC